MRHADQWEELKAFVAKHAPVEQCDVVIALLDKNGIFNVDCLRLPFLDRAWFMEHLPDPSNLFIWLALHPTVRGQIFRLRVSFGCDANVKRTHTNARTFTVDGPSVCVWWRCSSSSAPPTVGVA